MKRFMLVYQCGLANVFRVERFGRTAAERGKTVRVLQHAYDPCVWFAIGAGAAGASVRTAHCDMAGDCASCEFVPGKGDLWAESKTRVRFNKGVRA